MRLANELSLLLKDRPYLFYAKIQDGGTKLKCRNHFIKKHSVILECGFPGPNDVERVYEDSYYRILLVLTDYPEKPPHAIFKDSVFHPNVYIDGLVCLDLLADGWKPTMGIVDVLRALQALLENPNTRSPANGVAAALLKKSKKDYQQKVKENIKHYHSKFFE